MNLDFDYSKMSQDDLIIKILEFVCKNKDKNGISPELIQSDLFPELTVNDIIDLFDVISHKRISQITVVGKYKVYLKYRIGLEDYVKKCKQLTKKEKLHRIVEFLSTENERIKKGSFNSGQIAKAFTPELDIYEVNTLCKILISNGDVQSCTSKDESSMRMIAVSVINATHDAYHTKKYLEDEDYEELISVPIYQNIVTGHNIITGDISGTVTQEDHSNELTKDKGKPKWLKWLFWILGAILIIFGIIEAIIRIF